MTDSDRATKRLSPEEILLGKGVFLSESGIAMRQIKEISAADTILCQNGAGISA